MNHVLTQYTGEVRQICEPLFNHSPIKCFNFSRYYKNGAAFCFTTIPKWLNYYYARKDLIKAAQIVIAKHKNQACLISSEIPKFCAELRNNFQIDEPIIITKSHHDYIDAISFAASYGNHQAINFYLNNYSVLEKFILYFKDKAAKIMVKEEMKLKKHAIPIFVKELFYKENKKSNKQNVNKTLKLNKIYLDNANQKLKLSKREIESLIGLLRGKTYKEIGRELNITAKTAESYIMSVKNKLTCNSRAELFDKAFELGFFCFFKSYGFFGRALI